MLGLWDGNPVKLDCYDHYITTNVINYLSNNNNNNKQLSKAESGGRPVDK